MKILIYLTFLYIFLTIFFGCTSSKTKYRVNLEEGFLRGDPYSSEGAEVTNGFKLSFDSNYDIDLIELPDNSLQIVFKDQSPEPEKPEPTVTIGCKCVQKQGKQKGNLCKPSASTIDETGIVICESVSDKCTKCDAVIKINSKTVVIH